MTVGTATDYTAYGAAATTGAKANGMGAADEIVAAAEKAKESKDSAEISELARELATNSELDSVNTSKTAEQEKFASTESRENEGARLDAYLADLRSKYGEEEAMTKFNEYMRSEGYEIHENVEDSTKPRGTSKLIGGKENVSGGLLGGSLAFILGMPLARGIPIGSFSDQYVSTSNTVSTKNYSTLSTQHSSRYTTDSFTTSSTVAGEKIDGKMQYSQATWAKYNAGTNSEFKDTMEFWKNRNVQKLSEQSGVDIGKYVDDMSLHWGKAFAAESVSSELGGIMNTILNQAGITLEPGQNLNLRLGGNAGLIANIDFGDDETRSRLQSALNTAIKANSGILSAFQAESDRTAEYDLGTLEGAYSNGIQSNSFTQQRIFTMSGSQPSLMVMGSGLDHMQKGYTYIKKVSDSLDVNADLVDVRGNTYTTDTDPEEYARIKGLMNEIREQREK